MPDAQDQEKPSWLNRMFSDANGVPDEGRVGAMLLIVSFCGASIASVVMSPTHAFDMQDFGVGAGALAGGLGALFGFRKDY